MTDLHYEGQSPNTWHCYLPLFGLQMDGVWQPSDNKLLGLSFSFSFTKIREKIRRRADTRPRGTLVWQAFLGGDLMLCTNQKRRIPPKKQS